MGVVVPRSLSASGYNSAFQPNSDAYFPEVRTADGVTSKAAPSLHQGIVYPSDISITEEGGKQRKSSSPSPRRVGKDRPTMDPIETVVEKPGISDVVPIPANRGDVNEEGETDETD